MGVLKPEGKVKVKIRKWVKDNMPGAWHYAPPGGMFGRNGVPDDIWLWRGKFFAIEAKADDTRGPSDLQRHELNSIKRAGGISCVMYGFEEGKLAKIRQMILTSTKEWVESAP